MTLWWVLSFACAAFIIYWGNKTATDLPKVRWLPPHFDKFMHASMYGGLAALISRAALPPDRRGRPFTGYLLIIAIPLIVGIIDEVNQSFSAGRSSSGADLMADFIGAAIVCLGVWAQKR